VALRFAPERIYFESDARAAKLDKVMLALMSADRVPVVENGVRACGYVFEHCCMTNKPIPGALIVPFCKLMNHSSNDVKQLVAVVSTSLAKAASDAPLPTPLIKSLLPMLVNGSKEKNSAVKASSESALVSVLRMRTGSSDTQAFCLSVLEGGAKEALQDVIAKVLNRVASQPEGKEEDIDNSVLT
jgi:hypothetical protein